MSAHLVDEQVSLAARHLHQHFCGLACPRAAEHATELATVFQRTCEDMFPDEAVQCAGCLETIVGEPFNAGCNGGCRKGACSDHLYCVEGCYVGRMERADERRHALAGAR